MGNVNTCMSNSFVRLISQSRILKYEPIINIFVVFVIISVRIYVNSDSYSIYRFM